MKICLLLLCLTACMGRQEDPLVQMSEDVEKRDRGINIEIIPIEKRK